MAIVKLKVKERLSLQFTFMFAVLLLTVLAGIYWFAERNRVTTFFDQLDGRAVTVAQFYLAEDNLSKENFKQVLSKFPQSLSDETIRIYDAHYRPQFIPEDSIHWPLAILQQVAAQKKIHFFKGVRQVTGIFYRDNSGDFIILVSAADVAGYHYLHELGLIMTFFFLASLFITFFMGNGFARISLLPIVKITSNLKRIRASSLDLRLPTATPNADEIDNLSLTINQLLEHLEQSFESQQSFIANASHELRTPITTILGEAETTLLRSRSSEEYQATLYNIVKETERLYQIINSLMELIQTNGANYEFQPVRMDELLWQIEDELNNTNVKFNYLLPANSLKYIMQGNRQLLFMGISNIVKNAIKFSDNGEVHCKLFCDQSGIHIMISDQGIGIDSKDINKIFEPFFRAFNALNYAGYGIGLSLTRNIVKLHNGSIQVKSEVGKGTTFHLIFQPDRAH